MFCQIYPVKTAKEALEVIAAGADSVGIVPVVAGMDALGSESAEQTIFDILHAVKGKAARVVIALSNDPEEVFETAVKFKPDIFHISGTEFRADKAFAKRLRDAVPGMKIMHAVQVTDFSSVDEAMSLQEVADILILDTGSDPKVGIGASGRTHDWNVSKKIVEVSKIPVILAGGLGPDNVYEAVRKVHPWGVDSMTHTHKYLPDGSYVKDLDKVRRFCSQARQAEIDDEKSANS